MKLNITIITLLICALSFGQKEMPPYNYTITEGNKTETIFIYASAEAVNSVTFTLKNAKNEILKIGDNKITFKVSPFNEVSFREKLVDALKKLDRVETKETEDYKPFIDRAESLKRNNGEKFDNGKSSVQEIRNIYQFFNALIITAFQYDNEPVVGILRYRLDSLVITKKTIQGLSTDLYFKRHAKFIRKFIIKDTKTKEDIFNLKAYADLTNLSDKESLFQKDLDSATLIKVGKNRYLDFSQYEKQETDGFLKFLRTNNKGNFIKHLYEFNQNSRKGLWNKARPMFKNHAISKLKEHYNHYELFNLSDKSRFFKEYKQENEKKDLVEEKIDAYLKQKAIEESNISEIENRNKSIEDEKSRLKEKLKIFQIKFREYEENSGLTGLKKKLDQFSKEKRKFAAGNREYSELDDEIKDLYYKRNSLIDEFYSENLDLMDYDEYSVELNVRYLEEEIEENNIIIDTHKSRIEGLLTNISSEKELKDKYQNTINSIIRDNKEIIRRFPLWVFKADEIELDINDGFLEHIKVVGEIVKPLYNDDTSEEIKGFFEEPAIKEILNDIYGKTIKFDNDFPFDFSSKSDFADLYKYRLFLRVKKKSFPCQ